MTDRRGTGPRWGSALVATAANELRRFGRDRVAVLGALVVPLAVAATISTALGSDLSEYSTSVAVVDLDGGPAAEAFVAEALGDEVIADVIDRREVSTAAEAELLTSRGDVDAAIVIHDGFSAAVAAGRPAKTEILRGDDPISGDLLALVVEGFETRAVAAVVAAEHDASTGIWPLETELRLLGGDGITAASHYGPALGVFFVLMTLGFAASRSVADRESGIIDRLRTTSVAPSAVLLGRAAAGMAVSAVSLTVLAASMQLLFDAPWGPTLGVVVTSAVTLVTMAALATFVATVCRTQAQARAMTVSVGFVLLLTSGAISPPGTAARPAVAEWVPITHALDAYTALATGADASAVVPSLAVLGAFGLVFLAAASVSGRRWWTS